MSTLQMSKVNEMNLNHKCPTHSGTEKEFGSSLLKYTNENIVHLQHFNAKCFQQQENKDLAEK